MPEALAELNFEFFDNDAHFEANADRLSEALNTDISWIRQHTDFGEQARRWALRSPVLEQAERWIAERPKGAPAPTEETQAFIRQSRQETKRLLGVEIFKYSHRQSRCWTVLALAFAGFAYWQRGIAVEQRGRAQQHEAQAKEALALARENESRGLVAIHDPVRPQLQHLRTGR